MENIIASNPYWAATMLAFIYIAGVSFVTAPVILLSPEKYRGLFGTACFWVSCFFMAIFIKEIAF